MEACPTKVVLPCYNENIAQGQIRRNLSFNFLRQPSDQKGVKLGCKRSRLTLNTKKSFFQDFQGFAEPLRLLPVAEAMIFSEASLLELITSSDGENSCLYVLKLYTSNLYGSELRDLHAAIVICLIDETRTSVLQRIPTVFTEEPEYMISNSMHFQNGSDEIILFSGPKLGKIEAIWVGLENV